jgi:DNA-binding MarR family transcriptional regulator
MQASDVKTLERTQSADAGADVGPEARDTAARICALMRHVFLYDRGNQLRVVEESGLSSTQCKALLELGGLGNCPSTWQVTDLAELFGSSLPAMSRAVDGLFERGLVERDEDPLDRRMKRVRLTDSGRAVPAALNAARLSALQELVGSLGEEEASALEGALALTLDRHQEIAAYRPKQKGSRR